MHERQVADPVRWCGASPELREPHRAAPDAVDTVPSMPATPRLDVPGCRLVQTGNATSRTGLDAGFQPVTGPQRGDRDMQPGGQPRTSCSEPPRSRAGSSPPVQPRGALGGDARLAVAASCKTSCVDRCQCEYRHFVSNGTATR